MFIDAYSFVLIKCRINRIRQPPGEIAAEFKNSETRKGATFSAIARRQECADIVEKVRPRE